ncbi:MAG: hypothetical protein JW827_01585 [Spirochaetes bacterium]|nr:hypothetical protein [Spirochaetota bacterium]
MKFQKHFDIALKSLKKGDYLNAITNFEECLTLDRSDYLVYYYMGITYIFRKDNDTAYKFIQKAYKLNPEDVSVLGAMGFLNLKEKNIQEAINYWLDALDLDPKNITIKRNLERVRKASDVNKFADMAHPENFIGLKTRRPLQMPSWIFLKFPLDLKKLSMKYKLAGAGIAVALVLFFVLEPVFHRDTSFTYKMDEPVKVEGSLKDVELPDIEDDYIQDKSVKKSLFKFSKNDAEYLFSRCKNYIQEKKYNSAIIIINKILHSDLHFIIKEKFKILKQFVPDLNEFKVKDNITYSEIMNFPSIHEDVQVIWRGKVDDVLFDEDQNITQFKLIIKEDDNTVGVSQIFFKQILPAIKEDITILLLGRFEGLYEGSRLPLVEGKSIQILDAEP